METSAITMIQQALAAIADQEDVLFSYDGLADIMLIHFRGTPVPHTAVLLDDPDDDVYVLVDRANDEIVGLQIDGFMADFMHRHPEFADLLAVAELRGISREDAVAAARRTGHQRPQRTAVAQYLERRIA